MAEPLEPNTEELTFEDGLEAQQEADFETLAERLDDEGYGSPEEIDEFIESLYDPAPRRGKRRHRGVRRHKTYDPAPRRRRRGSRARSYSQTTGRRPKKGMLGKLRPWIMPATAGLTFYAGYVQRAKSLNMGIVDAIMYDLKNFDGNAAMGRLQAQAGPILGATIGGIIVKKYAPGKLKMLGDVLIGVGAGTAGKAVLDPPGGLRAEGNVGSAPVQSFQNQVTVSSGSGSSYGKLGGS